MAKQFFGTDGVRGMVGEGNITPDKMLKLGWAAGMAMKAHGSESVIIGKDTRISGYMIESALQSGFCAAGVNVKLLGPMPTPGIAYLTQTFRSDAGVVISASHNAYHDNGVKFFGPDGRKISDDIEKSIEQFMQQKMVTVGPDKIGKVSRVEGAAERYIEFCKGRFPKRFSLEHFKIVVDCANGSTYHIAPKVLRELGAEVITIGVTPNGININDNVGSTSTQALQDAVLANEADVGIAYDGDGDRLIMVDHTGLPVDGDQLLFILARDALKNGRLSGGVVGTVMTNMGMEKALNALAIPFVRAKVGDRHVLAELEERGWHIGGEGSGHLLNLYNSPTVDGIVASLQVLVTMTRTGLPLKALASGYDPYPQVMKNVKVNDRDAALKSKKLSRKVDEFNEELAMEGRILIRPSGTEPVIRVMVEAENGELAERLCQELSDIISNT